MKFPFIGVTDGIDDGDHWTALGPAFGLYLHFIRRQTHPDGRVNYGKSFTYKKLMREITNSPPLRTLQRYMSMLLHPKVPKGSTAKARPYVSMKYEKYDGMKVTILRPKKWAMQGDLAFPQTKEEFSGKVVDKAVEKLRKPEVLDPPEVAEGSRHMWRTSTCIKKSTYEKNKSRAQEPRGVFPPVERIGPKRVPDEIREIARKKAMP